MGLFGGLYAWTVRWAAHPRAPWALGGLSAAESSFFPIPPDALLMPMSLARPERALRFAAIATLASVLGGLLGYALGGVVLSLVAPWIEAAGYAPAYATGVEWAREWGFWVMLVAGFSPIPYKVFTIAAGATGIPLIPFVAASLIGRGARFFLVAGAIAWGGPRLEPWLRQNVEWLGWLSVAALAAGILWLQLG